VDWGFIMNREGQSLESEGGKARPRWRTPQIKIENVTDATRTDTGAPGDDASKYPNHGTYS
jgi:hypothetical protein